MWTLCVGAVVGHRYQDHGVVKETPMVLNEASTTGNDSNV